MRAKFTSSSGPRFSKDKQYGQIRSTPLRAALNAGIASEAFLFTTVLLLMQKL